jgi:hypothetical protein
LPRFRRLLAGPVLVAEVTLLAPAATAATAHLVAVAVAAVRP